MFEQDQFETGVSTPVTASPIPQPVPEPELPEPEVTVVREYDGVPATLAVWGPDGLICATDYFILVSIDESDQEKIAPVFTFGDPVLFGGTGRQPRIYSYSGVLVDSRTGGPGAAYWRAMYERYFRGSKCVEMKAVVELLFRDQWRRGYIVGTRPSLSADRPQVTQFSFVMFVIDEGHS
jgi:hypothetical protein